MSDLISRTELIEYIDEYSKKYRDDENIVYKVVCKTLDFMKKIIELQPTVEAVPVVHAEWKLYRKQKIFVCTNCSFERNIDDNFGAAIACPNCGADMRKKEVKNES